MTPKNTLKTRLAAGETCYGIWLSSCSAMVAEMAGGAGFDWLLIDGEHSPNTVDTIADQVRALGTSASETIVRTPIGRDWIIKQVLDLGVQTLLVPMVDTAEEAAQMVSAVRYPPAGTRGVGAALARATSYGRNSSYIHEANDEICLIVQAESRAAIENIDAIAATPGVDVVFIGPADLSADMGHPGDLDHPEVQEAIAHAIRRIDAAGKTPGTLAFTDEAAGLYTDMGARFLGIGADISILRASLDALAAKSRA